ncbi:hypothetical protein H6G82_22245 [Planktothricoides sp. FACHB-1261]|nr:hypothetical protein [Planktothricoides raciborskii FACHB-1261]
MQGCRGAGENFFSSPLPLRSPAPLPLRSSAPPLPLFPLFPYTLHPTPYTLHPTPYTLHPTPYTPKARWRPSTEILQIQLGNNFF